MKPIKIQPLGIVRNNVERLSFDSWNDVISELIIDYKYQEALYKLDEYSHIYVLFHLQHVKEPFKQRIHPTCNSKYPLVGAFSTRTPNRPNRIGLTVCRLLKIQDNILTVRGLDAFDGSPILDLKPYFPSIINDVRVPKWNIELQKELESKT